MESTWWSRDLPVLDSAVRLFQEDDFVYVRDLARETGLPVKDVARSLLDMRYEYVGEIQGMSEQDGWCITEVTPEARRAVGQWPTPENVVASLVVAFNTAADKERDQERRGKLKYIAGFLADTGKDLATEIVAKVIARQTGIG
jgi:hypothetical protein